MVNITKEIKMLKNMMVVIATFISTACGSTMSKQAQTQQEFLAVLKSDT